MATCTLKAKYETLDGSICRTRAILCHSRNVKEIYYQYEDEAEAPPAESASDAVPSAPSAAAAAPAAPVALAAPTGPVARIEGVPVKAIGILLVVVAQKLKNRIDEIPLSKTIKDLVGRKSTLGSSARIRVGTREGRGTSSRGARFRSWQWLSS
jgi:fatty acid synthase subunit alpha, fungi type